MPSTVIDVSPELLEKANRKASAQQLAVSEVVGYLLLRWVAGEVSITTQDETDRIREARSSQGMWQDRDPDAYLASSREHRLELEAAIQLKEHGISANLLNRLRG